MDLELADRAIAQYSETLEEGDKTRLNFFRRLWQVQQDCSQDLFAADTNYTLPSERELTDAYKERQHIFSIAPVEIDEEEFLDTIAHLADVISDSKFFPVEVNDGFASVNWRRVVDASDLELAGQTPIEWLENLYFVLIDDGMDELAAYLGALIASMALKVQLEKPARMVMEALKDIKKSGVLSPLLCPVCGTAPMMAHVGGETSSEGRGRLLVCPQCDSKWEFERVRCARCGTQNQSHLHFFNVEGDDAHRIATCDECGGYIRTLYSDDSLALPSYDVEDVVMARLDAIANDPEIARSMRGESEAADSEAAPGTEEESEAEEASRI